jgi:hypothetical protein
MDVCVVLCRVRDRRHGQNNQDKEVQINYREKKSPCERKDFLTHLCPLWGVTNLLYNGYRFSFPKVKWPGHGVNHLPLPI